LRTIEESLRHLPDFGVHARRSRVVKTADDFGRSSMHVLPRFALICGGTEGVVGDRGEHGSAASI